MELLKAIKSADLAIIIDMLALETETNKESMAAQFMKEIDKGHFDFIEDVFKEIKVDDLRSALGALGLSENGTREKLMERLRRNMETVDEASSNFQQNSTANRPPVVTTADPLPVSQPTVATPPKFKSLQLDSIKVQGVNPADAEDFKNRFSVVSELDSFWIDEREMTAYMIVRSFYRDGSSFDSHPPNATATNSSRIQNTPRFTLTR